MVSVSERSLKAIVPRSREGGTKGAVVSASDAEPVTTHDETAPHLPADRTGGKLEDRGVNPMMTTLVHLLPRPLGGTHRFTVEDYYLMAETGILAPDARVELIDGEILDMMPIGPFHANAVRRLSYLFSRISGGRWLVDAQHPVRLNPGSEPQPDFVLLKPRADFYTAHPEPADVFLLVEVADSSLVDDRKKKLPLYARAGIAEYWLVNLPDRTVEVYREPDRAAASYKVALLARPGDTLAPAAFPDAGIAVGELLGGG